MFSARQLTPIRAVVFDFGGVLYTYNYDTLVQEFSKDLDISAAKANKAWMKRIEEHERGEISEKEFWKAFKDTAGLKVDDQVLHDIFIRQFRPMPETLALIPRLRAAGYTVGMLSNNCEWERDLQKKFNHRQGFDFIMMSYELGSRKPELNIFKQLIDRTGLAPEQIVFIDDTAEYAEAVHKAGVRFIPYRTIGLLVEELHLLGVWW